MKTIYKIDKTEKISPIAVTIVALSIASAFYYGVYVFNFSNRGDLLLYLLTFIVELYVLTIVIFTWWTILFHNKGMEVREKDFGLLLNRTAKSIAVIIPVFSEPLEVIEKTAAAAVNMDIPHMVYLADDGRREELKDLAKKYGITYFRRKTNTNFKSGNINNVLKYINPEFVVIFDSDHIPEKNFLKETLPYFSDQKVAFIQAPQFYSNTDNMISKGSSGSQNVFYELIMPGKNSFNSAFCVGTNVIFRKAALDDALKGKIYESIHSEDIWTSLILHEKGWKSIYIPKILAKGHAPDNLMRYFSQQFRWARGGFSILFKNNPLFSQHLQMEQKLQYFFSTLHYFSGFVILYYLTLPIIFLLTGFKPLASTDTKTWALHFLPFFISKFLLIIYLMESFDFALITTSIAAFPVYIKAFFSEISESAYNWVVTNTQKKNEDSVFSKLIWHFFFALLSIVSTIVGVLTIEERMTAFMFAFWAISNATLLLLFIKGALEAEKSAASESVVKSEEVTAPVTVHPEILHEKVKVYYE